MVFIGGAVLPHGALPFDNPDSDIQECRERYAALDPQFADKFNKLYKGSLDAAEQISKLNPDIVILHTPHGVALSSAVGVYLNSTAGGSAVWKECWSEYKVNISLDTNIARQLLQTLQDDGFSAQGIMSFGGLECYLHWGEVVPIWYLLRRATKIPKFVVLSQPSRRLDNKAVPLEDELQTEVSIGQSISRYVSDLKERVAVIISGDLSHVYRSENTNPLYEPAQPWPLSANNDAAESYEDCILKWTSADSKEGKARSKITFPSAHVWQPTTSLPWLHECFKLQSLAYSCGMIGFCVLHGILNHHISAHSKNNVASRIYCCEAPTYYGMMAATFIPVMDKSE